MSRIHLRLALFSSSCFFRFQKRRRRREKHQQRTFCSTGGRSFFFLPAFSFPLSFVVLTRTGESYFTKDISGGIIVALWFQLLSFSSSSFPFILQTQFQVPARLSKHLHALPLSVSLTRTSKEGCPVSGLCEQEGQSKRSPKNVSTESFNWWTHKHHTNLLGLRRREVLHKVGSRSQETSTRWEEKKTWQTKLSTLCCL